MVFVLQCTHTNAFQIRRLGSIFALIASNCVKGGKIASFRCHFNGDYDCYSHSSYHFALSFYLKMHNVNCARAHFIISFILIISFRFSRLLVIGRVHLRHTMQFHIFANCVTARSNCEIYLQMSLVHFIFLLNKLRSVPQRAWLGFRVNVRSFKQFFFCCVVFALFWLTLFAFRTFCSSFASSSLFGMLLLLANDWMRARCVRNSHSIVLRATRRATKVNAL